MFPISSFPEVSGDMSHAPKLPPLLPLGPGFPFKSSKALSPMDPWDLGLDYIGQPGRHEVYCFNTGSLREKGKNSTLCSLQG